MQHYGNIPTGPLMGDLQAGGVGKNCDSRPVSGFSIDDREVIYTNTKCGRPFMAQTATHQ